MLEMTDKERADLPDSAFVFPDRRAWPIHDEEHAKIALAFIAQGKGDAADYPAIRKAIKAKYPDLVEAVVEGADEDDDEDEDAVDGNGNPSTKRQEQAAKACVLHLPTEAMKALWERELTGQISDGMWENTERNCWEFWDTIPVVVDGTTRVTGKFPQFEMAEFDFGHRDLLRAVGKRMLKIMQDKEPQTTEDSMIRELDKLTAAVGRFVR
jgi:hypothetical protein